MSKSKILFIMTGSIAAFKACGVLSQLAQAGHDVRVVTTESALKFIGPSTIEGLTGKPPLSSLWDSGHAMEHIHLARWADLILVAPASANFINKISLGLGDDLASTIFLAHDFNKPFLLAPAMNTSMYLHPMTQSSLNRLKEAGVEILETASGVLACGEVGYGRLLDPQLILEEIKTRLAPSSMVKPQLKVLVTAGGTQEPIDDVRVLTNRSTGTTGAKIAEHLSDLGFAVTFLHAENSKVPQRDVKKIPFVTFTDLEQALKSELESKTFHAVIHAAAVSDFSLASPVAHGKLTSAENLTLQFKKNPKLVNEIKKWSPSSILISFKMTSTLNIDDQIKAVQKLLTESNSDIVVHNDMSEMDWHGGRHFYHWHSAQTFKNSKLTLENSDQLAKTIAKSLVGVEENI